MPSHTPRERLKKSTRAILSKAKVRRKTFTKLIPGSVIEASGGISRRQLAAGIKARRKKKL